MPAWPFDSASSTGSTKQADSWPSGRPAFIRVGEFGMNIRSDIRSKNASASASTAPSDAPYLRSGSATVRDTRQNRSAADSTGLPDSSRKRYRFSSTVMAFGDRPTSSRGVDPFIGTDLSSVGVIRGGCG